jgi:hypothetical protein
VKSQTNTHSVLALWLLGLPLWLAASGFATAASWTGTLNDGSVIKVDPTTHRAMRYYNGGVAPLWNGTHRLEDGSVVIVHEGQAVPTEEMMGVWAAEPGAQPEMRERYCTQLVRKVCGFHGECGSAQACVLANQLLRMEGEEQRRKPPGAGAHPQTEASGQCIDALSNPAFSVCAAAAPGSKETTCRKLVKRVCGDGNECVGSSACDPARQLLQMETEERLESADPDAKTSVGVECEKAMANAFFKPCTPATAEVSPSAPGSSEKQ